MTSTNFTIDAYNQNAKKISEKFQSIDVRVDDIARALELSGVTKDARVLELGSGDGRDAAEIIKHAAWYRGVEPSEGLIEIARTNVPEAVFELTTAQEYTYPENLDVVYASASLLHVDKEDIAGVFQRVAEALRPGGVFYLSLKYADAYKSEVTDDQWGRRQFYYYDLSTLEAVANGAFERAYTDYQNRGETRWITVVFRKI